MKLVISGMADIPYWGRIAKNCTKSWEAITYDKYLVTDINTNDLYSHFIFVDLQSIKNIKSRFLEFPKHLLSKKTCSFFIKMKSQVWALRNLKTYYDYILLLDTDIEPYNFSIDNFNNIINQFIETNQLWATGESNKQGHDSGVIILNTKHELYWPLVNEYENYWESGKIFDLHKWYDGHVVEDLLLKYPSFKIRNIDYGQGLHVYKDFGFVHWGSKVPKEVRSKSDNIHSIISQW